nr:MAG TPA: Interferon alpha/beta receptor 1, Interferon I interferon signaling complex [Caudoviricetes sp.]
MGALKIYASDSAVLRYDTPNANYHSSDLLDGYDRQDEMILTFAPTEMQITKIRYHKITAITWYIYGQNKKSSGTSGLHINPLKSTVDLAAVTYATKPDADRTTSWAVFAEASEAAGYKNGTKKENAETLRKLFNFGAYVTADYGIVAQTAKGTYKPYIEIDYEDETATPYIYPTEEGTRASEKDQTLGWTWAWGAGENYGDPQISGFAVLWRTKGTSTTHTITAGAGQKHVTVEAGTFPVGKIEWAVRATTDQGATSTSKWSEFAVENPKVTYMSPGSGAYTPKHVAALFTWDVQQQDWYSPASITPASATLQWRVTGDATVHSITVSGSKTSYTVPANTFAAESVDWRVTATTAGGLTATSEWITLTTTEAKPTARTVSPVGIVIDATIVNRFEWEHIIETGTQQSKADLQKSDDGTTWYTLATVSGSDLYYDVPADTFSSGTKYWRVRTYNTDATPSDWSGRAEFIAINSPSTPAIAVKSTGGRPNITWQSTEQEAYQLTLSDGYATGTVFGTAKEWRAPRYLADGTYTVRVRVQNQYGLWSEWGGATLPVTHAEGEAIDLFVTVGSEALLRWATNGSYDFYIVERDGVAIAKTTDPTYTDKTSIGTVTYRVRGCYADSYDYGLSDSRTVTVRPDTNVICDLEGGGEWLEMRLSETQMRANNCNRTSGIAVIHLAGLAYPVEERSETRDLTMTVSVAWPHKQADQARALELLVGKLVCVKDRYGSMAIGTLSSLECNADAAMLRYAFTIQHTNREEEINLDS